MLLQAAIDRVHVFARHPHDVLYGKCPLGFVRSSRWPAAEREHKKSWPNCIVCGTTKGIQVHHIFPFHFCVALGRPDLELDQRNLASVCETNATVREQNHHLLIAHLDNFKSANVGLLRDAKVFHGMTARQIENSPLWVARKAGRLKLLTEMTASEKRDLRALMDKTFPKAA